MVICMKFSVQKGHRVGTGVLSECEKFGAPLGPSLLCLHPTPSAMFSFCPVIPQHSASVPNSSQPPNIRGTSPNLLKWCKFNSPSLFNRQHNRRNKKLKIHLTLNTQVWSLFRVTCMNKWSITHWAEETRREGRVFKTQYVTHAYISLAQGGTTSTTVTLTWCSAS